MVVGKEFCLDGGLGWEGVKGLVVGKVVGVFNWGLSRFGMLREVFGFFFV